MREIKISIDDDVDDFDFIYERILGVLATYMVGDDFSIEETDE